MDYGPGWPPIPRPARRRLDVPMLRPWPVTVRLTVLIALVTAMVINTVTGGPVMHQVDRPTDPPTAQATTTVGPPMAGHGHRRHHHTP